MNVSEHHNELPSQEGLIVQIPIRKLRAHTRAPYKSCCIYPDGSKYPKYYACNGSWGRTAPCSGTWTLWVMHGTPISTDQRKLRSSESYTGKTHRLHTVRRPPLRTARPQYSHEFTPALLYSGSAYNCFGYDHDSDARIMILITNSSVNLGGN